MIISKQTITEILRHGDSTTMYEIVRTLIDSLNERSSRLKAQEAAKAKLQELYTRTEADRDRFRRIAEELMSLSREAGQEETAQSIVDALGGIREHEVALDDTVIYIELE